MRFKKKHFLTLAAVFLISIAIVFVSNKEIETKDIVLSKESGFYSKEFYLQIKTKKGNTVFYTLDGSEPNKDSFEYKEPILISNATLNNNNYSMNKDVSVGFEEDLINRHETDYGVPNYKQPDYLIDKCTIVRTIAFDNRGKKVSETFNTYFVGISPNKYKDCKVISLITNPENLFDYEKGIYVTGKKFDEYVENDAFSSLWGCWDSNYTQRGKKWERDAYINVFDAKGNNVLNKNVGIRIQGNNSRGYAQKSINMFSKSLDGNYDRFQYSFFDNEYNPSCITLFAGGGKTITKFNDYMMSQRTSFDNCQICQYSPSVLFIDGEYWGFYWIAEKYDKYYFSYHYNVEPNDVIMIKNDEMEIGDDKYYKYYYETMKYLMFTDLSLDQNYLKACEMIDIDNYINYYATMIYIGRYKDWPFMNVSLWRTKTVGNGEYNDGKWRWLIFDCNSPCMEENTGITNMNTLDYVLDHDDQFRSLWANKEFREKFKNRIMQISEQSFDSEDMNKYLDEYTDNMYPLLSETWRRYYGNDNDKNDEYFETMESYRLFFNKRKEVIEEIINSIE